jgi:hypothetical protein
MSVSEIRGQAADVVPDFVSLHPGYGYWVMLDYSDIFDACLNNASCG